MSISISRSPRSSIDASDGRLPGFPSRPATRRLIVCRPVPANNPSAHDPPKPAKKRPSKTKASKQLSHEYEEVLSSVSPRVFTLRRCVSDERLLKKADLANLQKTLPRRKKPPAPSREIQPRNGRPLQPRTSSVCDPPPPRPNKLRPVNSQIIHEERQPNFIPKRKAQSSANLPSMDSIDKSDSEHSESDDILDDAFTDKYRTRARLVRRKTIMYQQGEQVFKTRKTPQMFELAVIVELSKGAEICAAGEFDERQWKEVYKSSRYVPRIKFAYPPGQSAPLLASLPCLCYPDFARAEPVRTYSDQQFVITLTDEYGNRKFAYCMRFLANERRRGSVPANLEGEEAVNAIANQKRVENATANQKREIKETANQKRETANQKWAEEKTTNQERLETRKGSIVSNGSEEGEGLPEVAVIVSPVQSAQLYFELLREAVFRAKISTQLFDEFISAVFRKPFPARGGEYNALRDLLFASPLVPAMINHNRSALSRQLTHDTSLARFPFLAASLSASSLQDCAFSLQVLGAQNFVTIFTALLAEKRVLLVAKDLPELSQTVQALVSVLYPLDWPHTLIPVVPDSYVDLCSSPTPYLMGLLRSNLDKVKDLIVGNYEEFILVLDLNMGVIRNVDYDNAGVNPIRRELPSKIARNLRDALGSATNSLESVLSGKSSQRQVDERIRELFLLVFVELIGHWRAHVVQDQTTGKLTFQTAQFVEAPKSRSVRAFLRWFVETGLFQVWKRKRLEHENALDELDAFDEKAMDVRRRPKDARIVAGNFAKFFKQFSSFSFSSAN